ncbi:uncharacterized protein LOC105189243 isoform X2 [Harpegnathos saltator]|uniref:uncharacterized protein LOC105189243 isoform X2 n=1 Tax=Harpegnathos saltator TaxID=610380 RepID=UPI000DBEDD68|nr:uncharacterized protein LOC105189243 isoform X2 [Harpegnathos saltator]
MICIESQHFNLNRILFLAIGLWPYQQSRLAQLQTIFLFSILTSYIVFQLTPFITAEFSLKLVIKVCSSIFCFIVFVIKYSSFWIKTQTVKWTLEQLQHMCNELKDENEIAIIERYGYYAKCSTFRFTSLCIGMIVLVATGTMLIASFKHACGMFKIASYRIERAISITMVMNINLVDKITIYKSLIHAIDIHRKTMQFSTDLMSNFEITFLFLIVFTVLSLSLNLYQIFQIISYGADAKELLYHVSYVVITLIYMFMANYVGQEITDHNNHVFFTVYNIRWYIAPLHVQKLILFLLQRGGKTFGLTVGKLFISSLDCFATLTNASMSYFTLIYSIRQ